MHNTTIVTGQQSARERLDAHVREIVRWHFDPATGCPFWLERAKTLPFDPRTDVRGYGDLDLFGFFEDEWLRGGPVRRWVPKAYADKPIFVFETGGSTGVPKSRIAHEDFRIDYANFSETLEDTSFPKGSDWLMVGPSGPSATAARRGAPRPAPRRHLLHGRPRPTLGHQVDQGAADGAGRGVQAARRRSGADAASRAREHQVPFHDAEAARGVVREGLAEEDGHHAASSAAAPR